MFIKGKNERLIVFPKDKLPLGRAIFWIALSVVLVSGSAALTWFYYLHLQNSRAVNDRYLIKGIVQTGPVKEALRTVYLAELLDLSADKPTNLFQFDIEKAQQLLLSSPIIKSAKVKRVPPNILYIDYAVRQPIAMLYDYFNAAIDAEGFVFPLQPFFTPKRLPEVFLGIAASDEGGPSGDRWNVQVTSPEMKLALSLFSMLSEPVYRDHFKVLRIDVANAYADSYGRREIVLIIEDQCSKEVDGNSMTFLFPRILRLSSERYREELKNYSMMRERLASHVLKKYESTLKQQQVQKIPGLIIDLRVPQLAFIKE